MTIPHTDEPTPQKVLCLWPGLVPAKQNAVFMISKGTAATGLRTSNNYFSGGVPTISPASALPTASTVVVLDAQKQPGWSSAPVLELKFDHAPLGANGHCRRDLWKKGMKGPPMPFASSFVQLDK